jgi:hypothetical protein
MVKWRREMRTDEIGLLAAQYFRDLERESRKDTASNLRAWLWFTCPANLREEVEAEIVKQRKQGVKHEMQDTMDRL